LYEIKFMTCSRSSLSKENVMSLDHQISSSNHCIRLGSTKGHFLRLSSAIYLILSILLAFPLLEANAQISVCGDGVVDVGEECDDGNSIGYDTCNNSCVKGLDVQLLSIPGGNFMMGSNTGEKDERPEHLVKLQDNFLFSKTEVTHKQYKACVNAGDCSVPATGNGCVWGTVDTDEHPINCVNWKQASEFANFVGLRLPTEAEWEYVASSGDGRLYPWGNEEVGCEYMVLQECSNLAQPVCTSEQVPRPGQLATQRFPICDLAGNVAEWVEDNYSTSYVNASPTGIPFITSDRRLKHYRVLRGGAWFSNQMQFRVTDRYARIYLTQTPDTGIRLAKSTLCGNNELNQDFDGDGNPDPQHPDFEECDDGNLINSDGCDSNCTVTGCGNGIVNKDFDQDGEPDQLHPDFEYCDLRPVDGRACLANCTIDACGDGLIQPEFGEECDNGDLNSDELPNACRVGCRLAACGDGVIDDGEQCDDGIGNSDVDPNACRSDCTLPICGDGVIDDGETCDDAADNSDVNADACRTTCVLPTCGDNVIDSGELCDDGVDNSNIAADSCRLNCQTPGCGDGVTDAGEACDDGDNIDTNACLNSCDIAICGDGVRRTDIAPGNPGYEACDDANDENRDRCANGCQLSFCGDGIIRNSDVAPGEPGFEACDDGGDADNDGCSSGCTIELNHTCLGEPSTCFLDVDQDQVDDAIDNCLGLANPDQDDADGDGVGDLCDNCPINPNPDQANTDLALEANGITVGDVLGDVCDEDIDNDDIINEDDSHEFDPFRCSDDDNDTCDDCAVLAKYDITQDGPDLDDGDSLCNDGDPDDDGDGFDDVDEDTCGTDDLDALDVPLDTDEDGLCDNGVDDDDDDDNLTDAQEVLIGTDPLLKDSDGDEVQDDVDNCPLTPNNDQLNTDEDLAALENALVQGDALGDACDDNDDNDALTDIEEDFDESGDYTPGTEPDPKNPDTDDDGVLDGQDNCILVSNQDQQNTDADLETANNPLVVGDLLGDECDEDDDNDGLLDTVELGTTLTNPFDPDHDADGVRDDSDNCPLNANPGQENRDQELVDQGIALSPADGLGDVCDTDDDNDTIDDFDDVDSMDPFRCQDIDNDTCDDCAVLALPDVTNDGLDLNDGDNLCNAGDLDDDGDGFNDVDEDTCGTDDLDALDVPLDTDDDGLCDNGVDNDDDGDGLSDLEEAQIGTDPLLRDTDNDFTIDSLDNCPLIKNIDQRNTDANLASQDNALVEGDALGDACDDNDDNDFLTDEEEDTNGNRVYDNGAEPDPKNPDTDNDGVLDGADNCILVRNGDQQNTDAELQAAGSTLVVGDAFGDDCDTDDDNDGLSDDAELSITGTNPLDPDHDNDGFRDDIDNCPVNSNPGQENRDLELNELGVPVDADGLGDLCDDDDDNDQVDDVDDIDSQNPFRCQDSDGDTCDDCAIEARPNILNDGTNTDTDNQCNAGDSDDDNDGFSDIDEGICGTDPLSIADVPLDTDDDDLCDNGVDNDDDNDTIPDQVEIQAGTDPRDPDTDNDNVRDDEDNCPLTPNSNQANTDANLAQQPGSLIQGDSLGDACDDNDDNDLLTDVEEDTNNNLVYDLGAEPNPKNPDTDGDGVLDGEDNCILVTNQDQQNTDQELFNAGERMIVGDALGDACDPDDDNDNLTDSAELSVFGTSPFDPDHDDDGVMDSIDNCPLIFNDQTNTDRDLEAAPNSPVVGDDQGDACDLDDDNDGVDDVDDVATKNPFRCEDADNDTCDDCSVLARPDILNDGQNSDSDILCDAGDPDDDGDGFSDIDEGICGTDPLDISDRPLDTDGDELCDNGVDSDDDNDTIPDNDEDQNRNGVREPNETDPKLADTDGDGSRDNEDNCPVTPNSNQLNTDADRALDPNPLVQGDEFGDACDDNDDNDALTDEEEDLNGNGFFDGAEITSLKDPDTDGDFVIDGIDNCPTVLNAD
jgi:cysteine-rich repeat protein